MVEHKTLVLGMRRQEGQEFKVKFSQLLHNEFEADRGYMRSVFKGKQNKTRQDKTELAGKEV